MNQIGKIAVIGAGAVGQYYGGKLAAAGEEVHFLFRSDLDAVRRKGLQIHSKGGEIDLQTVNAHADTSEIGPCDLVIIALKATANPLLPNLIPPLLHENTLLLTLQNGLGNEECLAEHFGAERVLGGLCFVCLNRVAAGVVQHFDHGSLSIGKFSGPNCARTKRIVEMFQNSGIETRCVENLLTERWRKLVWNIPFNGLAIAAGGATVDIVLADPGLRALARSLMQETIEAAAKLGHFIPPEFVDFQIERSESMGAYKASSLIDYQAGREVEVEAIWGEPLRRAKQAEIQTPRLEMLYSLIKHLSKSRGENVHKTAAISGLRGD